MSSAGRWIIVLQFHVRNFDTIPGHIFVTYPIPYLFFLSWILICSFDAGLLLWMHKYFWNDAYYTQEEVVLFRLEEARFPRVVPQWYSPGFLLVEVPPQQECILRVHISSTCNSLRASVYIVRRLRTTQCGCDKYSRIVLWQREVVDLAAQALHVASIQGVRIEY
jgi:hypothetical protein